MARAELRLEIDADLLDRARSAGLEMTPVVEAALLQALANDDQPPRKPLFDADRPKLSEAEAEVKARQWSEENADAIAEHNAWIAEHGLVADHFRKW